MAAKNAPVALASALDMGKLDAAIAEVGDSFAPESPAQRISRDANARFAAPATAAALEAPRRKPPEEFRVLGMTEGQALQLSGDQSYIMTGQGSAFSKEHQHGDMANRWSHAAVAQIVGGAAESVGVNRPLAALAGAALFVGKEYGYDLHPSTSDLVITGDIYRSADPDGPGTNVSVGAFADGSVFSYLHHRF